DDRRRTLSTRMGRTARRPRHDALGRLLRVASRVCRARRVARAGRAARRRPRGPRVPRRRAPRERAHDPGGGRGADLVAPTPARRPGREGPLPRVRSVRGHACTDDGGLTWTWPTYRTRRA